MKSWTIVGYTYNVENYTPSGVIEADRTDESSFDSGEFPKVIFASMVEDGEFFTDADGSLVNPLA